MVAAKNATHKKYKKVVKGPGTRLSYNIYIRKKLKKNLIKKLGKWRFRQKFNT